MNEPVLLTQADRRAGCVEFLRFPFPGPNNRVEMLERLAWQNWRSGNLMEPAGLRGFGFLASLRDAAKTEPDDFAGAGLDRERIMRGRFRPTTLGVDRVFPALDDEVIDPVLHVPETVRRREQSFGV